MGLKKLKPCGPDLHGERKRVREGKNKGRLKDPKFLKACELAGVEPTKRQASKWNNQYGAAFARRNHV